MNFSKLLTKPTTYRKFHYPSQNLRSELTKAKDELFNHCYKDIAEHLNRQIRLSFRLKRTRLAFFPSNSLNITVINSFLEKLSTWVTEKSNISKRIDFLLLTSVTFLRAITMCSAFNPDCGYDNSTIILIVDVYCPNTKCLGKLCLHKKTFQSLGRSDYQCPRSGSVHQVRNIPSADRSNKFLFLVALSRGVHFWREPKISSRCYWRCLLS